MQQALEIVIGIIVFSIGPISIWALWRLKRLLTRHNGMGRFARPSAFNLLSGGAIPTAYIDFEHPYLKQNPDVATKLKRHYQIGWYVVYAFAVAGLCGVILKIFY